MFRNTLRCFAVDHRHQGEGLLNTIVSHLMEQQLLRGNLEVFLYTKPASARFFRDLGFYEIARVEGRLVFMENQPQGFARCLQRFKKETADFLAARQEPHDEASPVAAIVMNANPFTLGHRYLIEQASHENALVHLFLVSEDASLFPFSVRKQLVQSGIQDLANVCLHESGPYIISNATFPSYFLPDDDTASIGHAELDLTLFGKIAAALGIRRRYVGEEPFSQVTNLYNTVMREKLPGLGIECRVVPRLAVNGHAVSASDVRQCLKDGDWETLQTLVPPAHMPGWKAMHPVKYAAASLLPETCAITERLRENDPVPFCHSPGHYDLSCHFYARKESIMLNGTPVELPAMLMAREARAEAQKPARPRIPLHAHLLWPQYPRPRQDERGAAPSL